MEAPVDELPQSGMVAVDGLDVVPPLALSPKQFDMPESASFAELFVRGIGVGNDCGAVGDLAGKSPRQGSRGVFPKLCDTGDNVAIRIERARIANLFPKEPSLLLPYATGRLNLGISAPLEYVGESRFRRLASRRTDDACHPSLQASENLWRI